MATNITYEHLHHAVKKGEGFKKRLEAYREKLEGATTKIVRTLEVGAGAAVAGLIQGKFDHPHFLHMPVDLVAGLGLNIAGYLDAAGDYSEHLCNFGDGFVAAYTSGLGYQMGDTWKKTGKLFGAKAPAALPAAPSAAVVSGDASAMAHQMAANIAAMQQAQG